MRMASNTSGEKQSEAQESYTKMSTADVDAIGAHCQMAFCRQLDYLPFKCESCGRYVAIARQSIAKPPEGGEEMYSG